MISGKWAFPCSHVLPSQETPSVSALVLAALTNNFHALDLLITETFPESVSFHFKINLE